MAPQPLVTVLITSYNQERYIAQALESVLAQKTDFPFDILVSEDGGSDGTRAILQQYADRYPQIHLKLRKENVGISRNWFEGLRSLKSDYVCTLEGDDWWLCEDKLQLQMNFLRSHPDYVAVSHTLLLTDDAGNTYGTEPHDPLLLGQDATVSLFLQGKTFSCTACLCRNIFREAPTAMADYVTANRSIADFALCMLLLDAGRVFVMPQAMAAYRVAGSDPHHQNYNGSQSSVRKYQDFLEVLEASRRYWKGRYSFIGCCLAGTYFPFCDRIKDGGLPAFLGAMRKMPFICRLLFPFYFLGRSGILFAARVKRKRKGGSA